MLRNQIAAAVGALSCYLIGTLPATGDETDEPARVELQGIQESKPPLLYYSVRLKLHNQHDVPVWFILPYWGDDSLPKNGIFLNESGKVQPFGGKGFEGDTGRVVEVAMHGGKGFKAFQLPPKGQIEIDGYRIGAWKDIDGIVVLESRELKVNGMRPLEKWLPYGMTSNEKVKVGSQQANIDWTNLDWDAKKAASRTDYPNEEVKQVTAEGIRALKISFRQHGEKGTP